MDLIVTMYDVNLDNDVQGPAEGWLELYDKS